MKKMIIILMLLSACQANERDDIQADYPITPVGIRNVELTDHFWLPRIRTIQHTTIAFAFDKSEEEGRFENFLIAGGKMEGETRGKMPFDDTDVYKIIEGASYSLISSPDEQLDRYLDSVIAVIATGQEEDGYLTTWKTINPQRSPAGWCPPGDRWENLYCSHELYNSGHLFEAAAAHYAATGKRNFLDIALKNADLLTQVFGPGKNETPPGHQIVETGLIRLYRITGEKKYLDLARFFLDGRGDSTTHELGGPYNQDHIRVTQQDEAVGHAVRAVYMYAGMTDIGALQNDSAYRKAVDRLWENMVYKKLYITGGIGARHKGESFGDNYELPNLTAYSETCAAIGSVHWNHRLAMLTGDSKYYDVLERTLYNGLIAGISLDGKAFFYPNTLESDGKFTFNQGSCTRQSWFDCSCCPTNVIRFVPSMPALIYAKQDNDLYVNLFVSNNAQVELDKTRINIVQKTEYPWENLVTIAVNPEKTTDFNLKIRIPGWARNIAVPGDLYRYENDLKKKTIIKVNGEPVDYAIGKGYATLARKWQKNDQVEIILPMEVRRVVSDKMISSNRDLVALEYGPVVYCAEEVDNPEFGSITLPDDAELKIEKKPDLLNGINVITTVVEGTKLMAVPYHAWSNRGIGAMKVWLPR